MRPADWIDLRQISLFLQIAEAGSFSKAAVRLGVSQSALSRQVRQLETAAGTRVFYRDGRGIQLTEAGKRLKTRGANILAEIGLAREEMNDAADVRAGACVVAIQPGIAKVLAAPVAERVLREMPGARLRIMEGLSGQIFEWLAAGRVDVALHYDQPNLTRVNAERVMTQDLFLIGPRSAEMKLRGQVPAVRLAEVPLILPGHPHGLRLTLEALAARQGFALDIPVEIDSAQSIVQLVAKGVGYSALPFSSIEDACRLRLISASVIHKPRIPRALLMTIATHRPLTPTVRRIMQFVRQEAHRVGTQARAVTRPVLGRAAED